MRLPAAYSHTKSITSLSIPTVRTFASFTTSATGEMP